MFVLDNYASEALPEEIREKLAHYEPLFEAAEDPDESAFDFYRCRPGGPNRGYAQRVPFEDAHRTVLEVFRGTRSPGFIEVRMDASDALVFVTMNYRVEVYHLMDMGLELVPEGQEAALARRVNRVLLPEGFQFHVVGPGPHPGGVQMFAVSPTATAVLAKDLDGLLQVVSGNRYTFEQASNEKHELVSAFLGRVLSPNPFQARLKTQREVNRIWAGLVRGTS